MRLFVDRIAPLAALTLLAACGGGHSAELASAPLATAGPAADYPMTLGEPFTLEGVTWKPADTLNYDAVGYAAIDPAGGEAVTAAHKTLPLPSYAEVTSLTTGHTILVRVERRGPMTNSRLIALSPGAVAQLGLNPANAAVRVRRINPPEPERQALRSGGRASERMETPKSLLTVLNRKLGAQNGLAAPSVPVLAAVTPAAKPAAQPLAKPAAVPSPGTSFVQVAAFSTRPRADAVAGKLGGVVSPGGQLWRVRLGPFSSPAEASAALAKARGAGYSDARILRAD